jgi:phosphatidylserine/phosphatidylglycerophosphate/cardiolipin synthase-like enzyme
MAPFEAHYQWLGFEARRLILQVLDQVANDPQLTLDALIYESKEPDILRRLEQLGPRLRAIIDDHGEQGAADSCESLSAARLASAGAQVKRLHFSSQQHHKVLIVRRDGRAIRVLGGSTNFALRGLYIQANNVLLFDDERVAGKFAEVFEAYWAAPMAFRNAGGWCATGRAPRSRCVLRPTPTVGCPWTRLPPALSRPAVRYCTRWCFST